MSLFGLRFVVGYRPGLTARQTSHGLAQELHLRFEPAMALSCGADGLDAIRVIVRDAPACLRPGGWLLLEHGWTQGEAVRALFLQAGFERVETCRDYGGNERLTVGKLP